MLHAEILLHEVHALSPLLIHESIFVFAVQAVHNVLSEVLEEINLTLQFFREFSNSVVLANVDRTLATRSDVVKVSEERL